MRKLSIILIGLMTLASAAVAQLPAAIAQPTSLADTLAAQPAAVIPIRGEINDYSRDAFMRRLTKARALGAKVIIIQLDTPGGLVTSALDISRTIRGLRDLRTIAFIDNKAYSAGAMIALACDEVIMVPNAVIGDCAPITINHTGDVVGAAKALSPVLDDFRDSAARNGYDPMLVEAMVRVEPVIYLIVNETGVHKAVDAEEYKRLTADGAWKAVPGIQQPIDRADTLLTVSTNTALLLGLAKQEAASVAGVASARNLNVIATLDTGVGETIIDVLNSGIARFLLLSIFLTCLYAALHAPGHGLAEVLAVLCLAALVGIPLLTGYAQWWEIIAILVGIGLLALEVFVIPGFGVTGFTGIGLILIGFLMTFVAPEPGRSPVSIPRFEMSWSGLREGLTVTLAGLVCSVLLCMWLRRYLPRLPYFKGLILNTSVGSTAGAMVGSLTNIDPLSLGPAKGSRGKAVTDLKPGGSAEFLDAAGGSHIVAVVSDAGFITRGTPLVVREAAGNRVVVRPSEA
jgi:membrane-bound serine protease (ClpP class)